MSSFVPSEKHLRSVLLHYFIIKLSATEAYRLLADVYGEYALSKTTCDNWFQLFGQNDFNLDFNVEDEEPEEPTINLDDELKEILKEDPYQTLLELAASLNVDKLTVSKRLRAMGLVQKQGN